MASLRRLSWTTTSVDRLALLVVLLFITSTVVPAAGKVVTNDRSAPAGVDSTPAMDDIEEDDEETRNAHQEVETHFVFPESNDNKFQLGEPITILLGFQNKGSDTLNVTALQTFFHSPFDHSFYIQNFTARQLGHTVLPKTAFSIEYAFLPDPSLQPIPYQLCAYVFYQDEDGRQWANVFFNDTVLLYETHEMKNMKNYVTYGGGSIGIAIFIYLMTQMFGGKKSAPRAKKTVDGDESIDDWVDADMHSRKPSKIVSRKKSSKKKV